MNNSKYSLFLDRDGVINEKITNGYVKEWSEFKFIVNSLEAIRLLTLKFQFIFIVTNQRGVGLGLMSESNLIEIHRKMTDEIVQNNGRIDRIYYSTAIDDLSFDRKPNIGMGQQAKRDFPEVIFSNSIMVGDSDSDMIFARNLGMKCCKISSPGHNYSSINYDYNCSSLFSFASNLKCMW